MSNISILKEAFEAGYQAFFKVEQSPKGHFQNPSNPYQKNSLPWKEYERGLNRGYFEQQKRNA